MENWNAENIEKFEKILAIVNSKKFVNGVDVTHLYNDVFNKNLRPTNCGSCISQRVKEMKSSYENYLKQKEMALRAIDELMSDDSIDKNETKITTKRGRPKKE